MAKSDYHFFFPFRIRYAETDAQGIVFYGNYLTFFDTAIYEYFRALMFDFESHVQNTGADFHTVHVSMDFHAPARFDDPIEASVRTREIGQDESDLRCGDFLVRPLRNPGEGKPGLGQYRSVVAPICSPAGGSGSPDSYA